MVRSILWRLIGCLCFWWSLGLALFFISFGVNRIEETVSGRESVKSISGYQVTASVRDHRGSADLQNSAQKQGGEADKNVESGTAKSFTKASAIAAKVALTFDDGPHPVYTSQLLDGLKKRSVHATFFVVGENIPGNEALLKRMGGQVAPGVGLQLHRRFHQNVRFQGLVNQLIDIRTPAE